MGDKKGGAAQPRPISQPRRTTANKDANGGSWPSSGTTPTNNSLPHRDNNRFSPSSLSSSLDEKGGQQKLSPNRQSKTVSPRHQKHNSSSQSSGSSNDGDINGADINNHNLATSDSGQFSSGCSSMTNTPPPPPTLPTPPSSQQTDTSNNPIIASDQHD